MIVVRVELHSAVTGKVTEIARAVIANDGTGTPTRGHYRAIALRGRSRTALDARAIQREARVPDFPRKALHVWNLVAEALVAMGYGRRAASDDTQTPGTRCAD